MHEKIYFKTNTKHNSQKYKKIEKDNEYLKEVIKFMDNLIKDLKNNNIGQDYIKIAIVPNKIM